MALLFLDGIGGGGELSNCGSESTFTFDVISEEEYIRLCKAHDVKAMPSMCKFTIKQTNGVPTRAKTHTIVLGNFDPRPWSKPDCFSPVVSILLLFIMNVLLNKGTVSLHLFRLLCLRTN
jgi:hypothetical protein